MSDPRETFRNKIKSITESRLSNAQKQREAGKAAREEAMRLKEEGKSNAEIAAALDIPESSARMFLDGKDIQEHETIWFPGIYGGRQWVPWTKSATGMSVDRVIGMVQQRAKEDGEWAITNGFVGNNEDKMRKMMEWVSDETNIRQCLESIRQEEEHANEIGNEDYEPRTVDYICRDLANGSKWVGGSRG